MSKKRKQKTFLIYLNFVKKRLMLNWNHKSTNRNAYKETHTQTEKQETDTKLMHVKNKRIFKFFFVSGWKFIDHLNDILNAYFLSFMPVSSIAIQRIEMSVNVRVEVVKRNKKKSMYLLMAFAMVVGKFSKSV